MIGRTDGASLGAPSRLGALAETEEKDTPGDGFYDCHCDGPEFRFEMRNDRKIIIRQQERRKRDEGQNSKTTRKRATAAGTSVMRILGDGRVVRVQQSHKVRKRLC